MAEKWNWMSSGSWVKRKVKPGFSLKNFAGKTAMYFVHAVGATKSTELLTKDTDANAADTLFTTSVTDGSTN